jgi:hypothetical protein
MLPDEVIEEDLPEVPDRVVEQEIGDKTEDGAPELIRIGGKLFKRTDPGAGEATRFRGSSYKRTVTKPDYPLVFRPGVDDESKMLDASVGIKQEQERYAVAPDGIVGPDTLKTRAACLRFGAGDDAPADGSLWVLDSKQRTTTRLSGDNDKVRCAFYLLTDGPLKIKAWGATFEKGKRYTVPFDARTEPEMWDALVAGRVSMDVYVWGYGAKNAGGTQLVRVKEQPVLDAAALKLAYAERRVVIVKNQTRMAVRLPGNAGELGPLSTLDLVLPNTDVLRTPQWAKLVERAYIQLYVAEAPPDLRGEPVALFDDDL